MKVKPEVPEGKEAVTAESLKVGDCFVRDGQIGMLTQLFNFYRMDGPEAVDLQSGEKFNLDDEEIIIPVDCELTWKQKAKKKKKKSSPPLRGQQ